MECKCGSETVPRIIQSTLAGNFQKAEYQECRSCGRHHVYPLELEQYDAVIAMQAKKKEVSNKST